MGNGIVKGSTSDHLTPKKIKEGADSYFSQVDKLCRNRHFFEDYDDYASTMEKTIKKNRIDILELLLPSGNSQKACPLHLAAKFGVLECMELLLSAGFVSHAINQLRQTCLHCVAICKSSKEIGLCATLLVLSEKRTLAMRDSDGNNPLHLAVKHNNVLAVEAFFRNTSKRDQDKFIKQLDGNKQTPLDVAKSLGYASLEPLFLLNNATKAVAPKKEETDPQRIMLIWEKFFENCFKRMGVELEDSEDDQDDDNSSSLCPRNYGASYRNSDERGHKAKGNGKTAVAERNRALRHSKSEKLRKSDSRTGSTSAQYIATSSSAKSVTFQSAGKAKSVVLTASDFTNPYPTMDSAPQQSSNLSVVTEDFSSMSIGPITSIYMFLLEYIQWILCYCFDEDEYFVWHKSTGESRWFADHKSALTSLLDQLPTKSKSRLEKKHKRDSGMVDVLPTSYFELYSKNWMTMYDSLSNSSYYFQYDDHRRENYLPLKRTKVPLSYDFIIKDEEWDELTNNTLQLDSTVCKGDDEPWICADQSIVFSWVMVLLSEDRVFDDDPEALMDDGDAVTDTGTAWDDWGTYTSDNSQRQTHKKKAAIAATSSCAPTNVDDCAPQQHWYYYNSISLETSWSEPRQWDYLLDRNGGWTLCCHEEQPDSLFWWDPNSNETIWAEL